MPALEGELDVKCLEDCLAHNKLHMMLAVTSIITVIISFSLRVWEENQKGVGRGTQQWGSLQLCRALHATEHSQPKILRRRPLQGLPSPPLQQRLGLRSLGSALLRTWVSIHTAARGLSTALNAFLHFIRVAASPSQSLAPRDTLEPRSLFGRMRTRAYLMSGRGLPDQQGATRLTWLPQAEWPSLQETALPY